jgi:hypothetical protein
MINFISISLVGSFSEGLPSKKKLILRLHLIASRPIENRLKGKNFEIVLTAATAYGNIIGSKEIWLIDPLNEGVASHYAKYGFKLKYSKAHRSKYLHRSI